MRRRHSSGAADCEEQEQQKDARRRREGADDVSEGGEALVDGDGLLEAVARRAGLLHLLGAGEVNQAHLWGQRKAQLLVSEGVGSSRQMHNKDDARASGPLLSEAKLVTTRLARAADDASVLGVRRAAGLDGEKHDEVGAGGVSVHERRPHGAAAHGALDEARGVLRALQRQLLHVGDVDAAGLVVVKLEVVVLRLQEVPAKGDRAGAGSRILMSSQGGMARAV